MKMIMDGDSQWQGTANPFPAAAVAHVSDLRPEIVTIPTAAVREVDALIDSYLGASRDDSGEGPDQRPTPLADTGKICVIEGNYGTGKTHLAIEILDRMRKVNSAGQLTGRAFYDVAPGGTFYTFYADLMHRVIGKEDVLARVREFYADVVADSLRELPYAEALVRDLELGEVDPGFVVDRYGLKEGALQEALRHRLTAVTRDPIFSRGLALLLEPDLSDLAWAWLSGDAPGKALIEWGVGQPISADVSAMEALGVVALLYGRRSHRFVLVVDELEKLALDWDRSDGTKAQAFKRLLEVFRVAGACLVLCGLSDVFKVLPKDHGRIDKIIHPSPLSEQDVRWYITESQQRLGRPRTLGPFTEESVRYLIYLTGGTAREVVRLCYEAYQEASATGREVTPSMLTRIAVGQSPYGGAEAVRGNIEDLLAGYVGRPFTPRRVFSTESGTIVADFWVPARWEGLGCAVLLSESILEPDRAAELRDQLAAIMADVPGSAAILVVAGYLPEDLRRLIAEAVGDDRVLVYNGRTFEKDFPRLVSGLLDRIDPAPASGGRQGASEEIQALRTETEWMRNQQAAVLRSVRDLAGRTEERLNMLQKAVQALPSGLSLGGRAMENRLPQDIETLFNEVEQRLDSYGSVRVFVDEAFEIAADAPGARLTVAHRLNQAEAFSSMGVAAFLSDLLFSFRDNVRGWFEEMADQSAGPRPTAADKVRLQGICGTFDALYAATPFYRLDPLADLVDAAATTLARPSRAVRREALVSAFAGLGTQVFAAAVAAIDG